MPATIRTLMSAEIYRYPRLRFGIARGISRSSDPFRNAESFQGSAPDPQFLSNAGCYYATIGTGLAAILFGGGPARVMSGFRKSLEGT